MKLVLFDCDGTLVDSVANIHGSMVRTFAEAGLDPPSIQQTKSVIGLSLELAIARILGQSCDERTAALANRYKNHFLDLRSEEGFCEPLFDGVYELVTALGAREDIILGMVTGKSRRGVESVFKTHGFGHLFHTVRTADDCPSKPHPAMVLECCGQAGIEPSDTLVIGDAVFDMQMAVSAGARAIGVAWGYHEPMSLIASGAEIVLQRSHEIAGMV